MSKTGSDTPLGTATPSTGLSGEAGRSAVASRVTSESLLGERGELKIQHNGEQYSLRRTRQGKLILTK